MATQAQESYYIILCEKLGQEPEVDYFSGLSTSDASDVIDELISIQPDRDEYDEFKDEPYYF